MKSAKSIINSIQNSPLYNERKDINTIYALLQKKHKKLIKIMIIKENKLIIYCKHPLGLQELNNDSHKNDIKFGIKQLTRLRPQSILNSVNEIVIRLDRFSNPPQARDKIIYINEIPPSFERSKGKFINKFKDKTNYKIFEYIRKLILAKQ